MKSSTDGEQTDLRVRRTHKLLWDALMAELSARPFEEITVKDICDRAMVHRTTFYKHYADKYALLEQGMRQMYDALLADAEHLPPSAFTPDQPPSYVIRLFEHVAQYQQFYRMMLCGDGIARFQKLVKDYIADHALTRARPSPATRQRRTDVGAVSTPPAMHDMHIQFFAGGVLSLLAWWLEHDLPVPPAQLAHYVLSLHGTSTYRP